MLLRSILTIGAIQFVAILGNLVRSKTVAVLSGPQGVGVISNIDQFIQFTSYVSAFSLPLVSLKALSRAHSESDESFQRSYSGFLIALLTLSAAGMLVAAGSVAFVPSLVGTKLAQYRTLLLLAIPAIPSMSLGGYLVNVLASAQKPTASAVMTAVTSVVMAAAACAGIASGSIAGMYIANSCAGILLMIASVVYVRRTLNLRPRRFSLDVFLELARTPGVVVFGASLYLTTFATSLALLTARQSVLGAFGAEEAGLLHAALSIGLALTMVLNPTTALFLMPVMNRSIDAGQKRHVAVEFQRHLLIVLLLLAAPVVLFPKLVLTILFSAAFLAADRYIVYFVVTACLQLLAGVYSVMIIGFDDLKANAGIITIGAAVFGLLSLALVPRYGVFGVAAGSLLSNALTVALMLGWLRVRHAITLPVNVVALGLYGLAALLLGGTAFGRFEGRDVPAITVRVGVYVVFAASLLLFLRADERVMLWNRVRRLGSRGTVA